MKKKLIFFLMGASLTFLGTSQNLEKRMLGRWQMHQVIQNGNDVTEEHNPKSNRYFVFSEDGTFKSDGDPYGANEGRFFVNNLNQTLYIDSGQGPDDDSMWKIKLEGDLLIWQGFGTEWADGFKVVHKKYKK